MEKAKCKYCEFCKSIGRMQSQRGRLGRKTYYCENPISKQLSVKVFSNSDNCFIGFGNHKDINSPLELKTAPRWCPKNTPLN